MQLWFLAQDMHIILINLCALMHVVLWMCVICVDVCCVWMCVDAFVDVSCVWMCEWVWMWMCGCGST